MVVLAQVVVVQVDERLDGLLHGAHLDQRHLAVLPGDRDRGVRAGPGSSLGAGQGAGQGSTHWKNLNPLTIPPLLEKRIFRSSSDTEGLQGEGG